MAAYNFPNSPSDGDTVTVNGVTYTYSSSKTRWDGAAAAGSSTTVYATIDDLPLSGASTGDQAYVSGNNRLYLWNGTGWYNIALINTTPSISGASATYNLATDGTATTVTITATDPEGIPITYSIASDTSGSIATVSQGTGANTNVFTITPSTNTAHAGTFSLTFRASDGVNIATAVSSFTLVFSIVNSNYTTALITSVGANNAVNNVFDDLSTNDHSISVTGSASQNTFSPYRHAGYSTYISGGNDQNLYIASNTATAVESGDFTLEAWCWFDDPDEDEDRFIYTNFASWGANAFLFGKHSATAAGNGKVVFWVNNNDASAPLLVDPNLPSAGWLHYCVTRSGNTFTLYRNGSSVATATSFTGAVTGSSNISYVGEAGDGIASFKGYLRDVRLIKGTAVTPPSGGPSEPLTAVTNTGLLTCHLPYIADGSTNSHSITINGDVKTEPFTPFEHRGYTATDHGASIFVGSGDHLDVGGTSDFTFGTGDYTVEAWIYATDTSNTFRIFNVGTAQAGSFSLYFMTNGKFQLARYGDAAGAGTTTNSYPHNQWLHVRGVRSSGTTKLFVNGVEDAGASYSMGSVTATNVAEIGRTWESSTTGQGFIADLRVEVGTAISTSAFIPPTAPVSALTNTDLLIGARDAGIIDKSQSVKGITLNGNVKSSTSYYKYLTSSMYFDGSGDYLTLPASDLLKFGTGAFTIEFWMWNQDTDHINNSAYYPCQIHIGTFQQNNIAIRFNNNGTEFRSTINGTNTAHTVSIPEQTWVHVAFTRDSSGDCRFFLGGTQIGSTYSNTSTIDPASETRIGRENWTNGEYFKGYLSDVRITKGYAHYTGNYTPPTSALEG